MACDAPWLRAGEQQRGCGGALYAKKPVATRLWRFVVLEDGAFFCSKQQDLAFVAPTGVVDLELFAKVEALVFGELLSFQRKADQFGGEDHAKGVFFEMGGECFACGGGQRAAEARLTEFFVKSPQDPGALIEGDPSLAFAIR